LTEESDVKGREEGEAEGKDEEKQVLVLYQRPHPTSAPSAASADADEQQGQEQQQPLPSQSQSFSLQDIIDSSLPSDTSFTSNLNDSATFQSEKTTLYLSSWKSLSAATSFEKSIQRVEGDSVEKVRVVRDYGKEERGEAPGRENEGVENAEE
jgi:hypothetical protein